jgi:nucleotide-binding universal stress UspA family protein
LSASLIAGPSFLAHASHTRQTRGAAAPRVSDTVTVFKRIVVAYNDSPGARHALEEAVQLARETDAELFAVAVEQSLMLAGAGDSVAEVRAAHASRERACTGWLSAALAYADEHEVALRTEIRIGQVARQLAVAAAAHRADLLIVGRSGHGRAWRHVLGTTGDKVSHEAGCPVMIVP